MDAHLQASIDQAGGIPDENGHYAEVIYAGCETRERANEIKQGLHRSKRYLNVSCSPKVEKSPDGTFLVRFRAYTKQAAKKYLLEKYGTDVNNWPYRPRGK